MKASDILRIRVEPDFKRRVTSMYEQRGTTVSQAVRTFLADELAAHAQAADEFNAIMAAADEKLAASGLGQPTIENINDYIAHVRAERADAALAAL